MSQWDIKYERLDRPPPPGVGLASWRALIVRAARVGKAREPLRLVAVVAV
jgi:deoxyinosine 3'endonuclease (endonuclease V)